MAEQPRRMKYRQNFENVSKEKKPGFWEGIFGKKSKPEIKPNPQIDNAIDAQISRNKIKERATKMAMDNIRNFKEKNQRYPSREEMDKIAQQIYTNFERDSAHEQAEKEEQGKEKQEGFVVQKEEAGKSALDERKARRESRKGRGKGKDEAGKVGNVDSGAVAAAGKTESPAELRRKKRLERKEAGNESAEEGTPAFEEHEVGLPQEDAKNMSVNDLFGEEGKGSGNESSELSLGGLDDIDELKDLDKELGEMHDDLHLTKDIETDKNKCPSCGTKTKELVFCPNCGNAFCNHCAKKVEVQKESVGYTCPKCGSDFKLKK
jgi:predicted RNA-binding Zn-ribbon protein involved in translation (DUF1610 family)